MNGYFAQKLRGSGRTARQILEAPRGSVFVVWDHGVFDYTMRLMDECNRRDLSLVSFEYVRREQYRGDRRPYVVDHDAQRRARQLVRSRSWDALDMMERDQLWRPRLEDS